MFRIIEQSCIGKKTAPGKDPRTLCEDDLFVSPRFAAVIDGSTSKASRTYHPAMSNGKLASHTIKEVLARLPFDADLPFVCQCLEQAIQALYKEYDADPEDLRLHPENRITASAVIYSDHRREVWMIGDCLCMAQGIVHTNEKPHEAALADRRSQELQRLLAEGYTVAELQKNDLGRTSILQGIIDSTLGQNKTFAVIDGFPTALPFVKTIAVGGGAELILASDGYPVLCPTLQETEERLAHIVRHDPLMMCLHKATKGLAPSQTSFDDRTYLRIGV